MLQGCRNPATSYHLLVSYLFSCFLTTTLLPASASAKAISMSADIMDGPRSDLYLYVYVCVCVLIWALKMFHFPKSVVPATPHLDATLVWGTNLPFLLLSTPSIAGLFLLLSIFHLSPLLAHTTSKPKAKKNKQRIQKLKIMKTFVWPFYYYYN